MKKEKIKQFISDLLPKLKYFFTHLPQITVKTGHTLVIFSSFFLILIFFIITVLISFVRQIPFASILFKKLDPFWNRTAYPSYKLIYEKLESLRPFKIKRRYLIYVAYQNLLIRKSRSLVTILGMSIGVGIIVYLLSLGYGIERLVISQVASLQELQMIDVSPGTNTRLALNKNVITKIRQITGVKSAIPHISLVGRLNYNNAKTDIMVNAVPPEFLESTKLNVIEGKFFSANFKENYIADINDNEGEVAGTTSELIKGKINSPVSGKKIIFNILPSITIPVYKTCDINSELIGVTIRQQSDYEGVEYWGGEYAPLEPYGHSGYDENSYVFLGIWVKADVLLYSQTEKDQAVEPVMDKNGVQKWESGCIQRSSVQINQTIPLFSAVLGEATASASLSASLTASSSADLATEEATESATTSGVVVATDSAGLEIVRIDKTDVATKKAEKPIKFRTPVKGEALISSGLMKLLNLTPNKVINEKFKISFTLVKRLAPQINGKAISDEVEYKIVGVVDDDETQQIYVDFSDVQQLGIVNFSQLKVILNNENDMSLVRKQIETMGFKTASTQDTKKDIETFFNGLRGVLGILGFIALGVASLGMFNTLTVSLLERTREIGGMKTMGMISGEIQELFLAEAMIMGLGGGVGGLALGYLVGKLTSYVISIIAITQGLGYLELTHIPFSLVVFIILSSFVVGLVTGLYPSYRARKISALNALRYE